MERLAQLEEETTQTQTTWKLEDIFLTDIELVTLGTPKVSTKETRDWNESLILEAYDAAGSKQLPQNLKRIQDSGGEASLLAQLNEKEKQLRANH